MNQESTIEEKKPVFESDIRKEVINAKTGELYQLIGGAAMSFSGEDIARIAAICSQEAIYDVLFKRKLKASLIQKKMLRAL